MSVENWQRAGFGIYIHWPFCQAKCPYCDFNSHVSAQVDHDQWEIAYLSELDRYAKEAPDPIVSSVFFGGGTPSLMEPRVVGSILDRISANWRMGNDVEITLEANPTSVEAHKFDAFKTSGVNRVSIGIQSLIDEDLQKLGRLHSVKEALLALTTAQKKFDRISFDLIYARQGQSMSMWEKELKTALSYGTDHISLYQLTIEDGTAFGRRFAAGKLHDLPDENLSANLFQLTQDITAQSGLPAYEISNHARPGHESRHNLIYWRGGDYIGIGPGAHGRFTLENKRFGTESHKIPHIWLKSVDEQGIGEKERLTIAAREAATEYILMALRLHEGLDLGVVHALDKTMNLANGINRLLREEMIEITGETLKVTEKSRLVLNSVILELIS